MLIADWRVVLRRAHSVWVQLVQLLLGLLSWLDPGTALAVWNQMPAAITARVPAGFVAAIGALLFVLALLTIVLRLVAQPKLNAKLQANLQTNPQENSDGTA